jgi:hypothetical protein
MKDHSIIWGFVKSMLRNNLDLVVEMFIQKISILDTFLFVVATSSSIVAKSCHGARTQFQTTKSKPFTQHVLFMCFSI